MAPPPVGPRSGGEYKFGEHRREPMSGIDVGDKFVVAPANILDKGGPAVITCTDRSRFKPADGIGAARLAGDTDAAVSGPKVVDNTGRMELRREPSLLDHAATVTGTTMANLQRLCDVQSPPVPHWLALTKSFNLVCDGKSLSVPHSAERVLAYLALAGAPVSRSKLAGILWLDTPGQRAANNLRTVLWRLQRINACVVTAVDNRLQLTSDLVIDVVELSHLARRLIREPESDALNQLPLLLEQIELLPDWDDEWVVADQERLRMLRVEALERAATALLGQRRLGDALIAAQAVVDTEPLRESARRLVIEAQLIRGNVAEAICQYRMYRDLLRAEFAITPSPVMEQLIKPWLQQRTGEVMFRSLHRAAGAPPYSP